MSDLLNTNIININVDAFQIQIYYANADIKTINFNDIKTCYNYYNKEFLPLFYYLEFINLNYLFSNSSERQLYYNMLHLITILNKLLDVHYINNKPLNINNIYLYLEILNNKEKNLKTDDLTYEILNKSFILQYYKKLFDNIETFQIEFDNYKKENNIFIFYVFKIFYNVYISLKMTLYSFYFIEIFNNIYVYILKFFIFKITFNNFFLFFCSFEFILLIFSFKILLFTKYIYNLFYLRFNKILLNISIIYTSIIFFINFKMFNCALLYKTLILKYDSWFFYDLNIYISRTLFLIILFVLFFITSFKKEIINNINKYFGEYLFILYNYFVIFLFLHISNNYILFFLNLEIITFFLYVLVLLNNFIYEKYFFIPLINYFFFSIVSFVVFISSYFFFSFKFNFNTFSDLKYIFLLNFEINTFLFYFIGLFLLFLGFCLKIGLIPFHIFMLDLYKSLNLYFLYIISIFSVYINFQIFIRFLNITLSSCYSYILNFYNISNYIVFSQYNLKFENIYLYLYIFFCFLNMIIIIKLIFVTNNLNTILGLSSLFQVSFLLYISQFLYYELYILSIMYFTWYIFLMIALYVIILKIKNLYSIYYINIINLYNKLDFFNLNLLLIFLMGFPPSIGWFFKFYFLKYLLEINLLFSVFYIFIFFLFFSYIYVKLYFFMFKNKTYIILENEKVTNHYISFILTLFSLVNLYLSFYPNLLYDLLLLNNIYIETFIIK